MGCLSTKEADDGGHLVVDGGRHTCRDNCYSNGSACRSCSGVVLICSIQTCSDCGEIHCANCLQHDSDRPSDVLVCSKCLFLSSGQFMPQDLTAYSIRELRQFLSRKDIVAEHCKEKSDLIELVMLLSCSSEYLANVDEHSQHLQMLRDRMLTERLTEPRNTSPELRNDPDSAGFGELPLPVDAIQSVSIDSAYSSTDEKLSSSGAAGLEFDKENPESAATEVSRNFCIYDCAEEKNEGVQLKQSQNVSEEIISAETEPITTDEKKKVLDPLCRICSKTRTDCVFLECGHMIACYSCGEQISECPICFNYITRRVRAFRV